MQISQEGSAADLSAFLERGRGHVHFVGVCGIGMAGLASLLKDAGFGVSGCDLAPGKLAVWLEERGIPVSDGHDPAHVTQGVDLVVRSAAVPVEAPEIERARGEGVPVFSRGEVLSHIAWPGLVAVGGTHGKTTTTTFIAQLLKGAGRDPSWCVGGEVSGCGCVGVSGSGSGGITVVEADESDGTLALYRPDIAVVTNIEFDHMEHFGDADAFRECFRTFMDNAGVVVYCGDDSESRGLARERCQVSVRPPDGADAIRVFTGTERPTTNVQLPTPKSRALFIGRWALDVGRWALKKVQKQGVRCQPACSAVRSRQAKQMV